MKNIDILQSSIDGYSQRVRNDITQEFRLTKDEIEITIYDDTISFVPQQSFDIYLPWLEKRYTKLRIVYA